VKLSPPDWAFNRDELRAAFGPKTKGIIVNTPHNPTGKVFTRAELDFIAQLAVEHDTLIYTDEIYEHIVYAPHTHVYPQALPGLRDRVIAISGLSKTFSVTGWRLGYCIAPPEISAAIRKVHDFLTVGAPAPLQEGAAMALRFDADYYEHLAGFYGERREILLNILGEAGFKCFAPDGAYYIMTEYPDVGIRDDIEFARFLIEKIGVACVPCSSFYRKDSPEAKKMVRFCFCKKEETLREAGKRLKGQLRIKN
jgi:aminotransferase